MHVFTAGIPGSGDLFDEKWQYRQFIPRPPCDTGPACFGCGKLTGCSGSRPWEDEAPLYAESTVAAAARARKPGITDHFRFFVIAATWAGGRRRRARGACPSRSYL
jgi:hypothetical protein